MNISFDFDGTISDEFDNTINPQKEEICKIARKYILDGHNVCIITKRYDYNNRHLGKINEYSEVIQSASIIGIKNIYFTNREYKHNHIIDLNIDIHFENDKYEVKIIENECLKRNHKCIVVPVEDPYWRDLVY